MIFSIIRKLKKFWYALSILSSFKLKIEYSLSFTYSFSSFPNLYFVLKELSSFKEIRKDSSAG